METPEHTSLKDLPLGQNFAATLSGPDLPTPASGKLTLCSREAVGWDGTFEPDHSEALNVDFLIALATTIAVENLRAQQIDVVGVNSEDHLFLRWVE